MAVLVTGGAGYIGSVVVEELLREGVPVVVYDNLSKGHREAVSPDAEFIEGDLLNQQRLIGIFLEKRINAVVHMAAYSLVGESVTEPAKYYHNNVVATLSLLEAMNESRVSRLVFSSTAAVYGDSLDRALVESDTTEPTNPYGETKLAIERALRWYENAYGLKSISLRYFNAAGATTSCGELHHPETHLIPLVLQVAAGVREYVEIYGDDYPTRDGTCVRDYIHVVDLARAHLLALNALQSGDETRLAYNLGCGGDGYSVLEVVECARRVTGRSITTKMSERRPGDPAVLIAGSDLIASELKWSPRFQDLDVIVESAWKWLESHPSGY